MAEGRAGGHLVVWDSPMPHDRIDATFVDWNGYEEKEGCVSLLRYVEENADDLRERYLSWVDELGETRIGGRRIVDRMAVGGSDFSLWWMSSIAEKSFWNTPTMATIVRLLALDELVRSDRPSSVLVVSDQASVRQAVRRLCAAEGIACRSRGAGGQQDARGLKRRLAALVPRPIWAMKALADHALNCRPVRGRRPGGWDDSDDALFLLSCFGHLDPAEASAGRFDSKYWHGLYGVFRESGIPTNWVQYFVTSPDVPDRTTAGDWLERIDANPNDQGNHVLLDSYVSWRLLGRVFLRWIRQLPAGFSLRVMARPRFGPGIHAPLWPVVRAEWLDDLRGVRSIHHQLWLATFEVICDDLPRQRRGMYLHEGVSWEKAFIHAWRTAGHGELVGVPHATIRFWDLRYYVHPRTRDREGPRCLPQPDRLVRNNVTASEAFKAVGYPEAQIVDCEALRYSHLLGLQSGGQEQRRRDGPFRILILGEMRASATRKMLEMMAEAMPHFGFSVELAVKAHPNSPIRPDDHPELGLRLVHGSLGELVGDYDAGFSSHGTSAGVDVLLAGLPVVVWLDDEDLNLSDLRGLPGVGFVGSSVDLVDSFRNIWTGEFRTPSAPVFFTLDAGLPRWRDLLTGDHAHRPRNQSEALS